MVTLPALLTGVCGGSKKLVVVPSLAVPPLRFERKRLGNVAYTSSHKQVVVPRIICADCSIVFSGMFLGLCGLLGEKSESK